MTKISNTFSTKGKIITIASALGGAGKTTAAICTASMLYYASLQATKEKLRDKPLRVALVDLDIRDGQIAFYIRKMTPTALNILVDSEVNKGISKELISNNLIFDENLGVSLLLAPRRSRNADFIAPEFYQNVLSELTEMFDIVILDASVNYLDKLLNQVAYPMADKIMFICDMSATSLYSMVRWVDEITNDSETGSALVDIADVGVVVNRVIPGFDKNAFAEAAMGAEIVGSVPSAPRAVIAAGNGEGLHTLVLENPSISQAYFEIVKRFFPEEALVSPLKG